MDGKGEKSPTEGLENSGVVEGRGREHEKVICKDKAPQPRANIEGNEL